MPDPKPEFDQYYPGGVMKQMADLAGVEIRFNQDAPGGVIEQLRLATTPDLELSQYGPGGPHGQIGYTITGVALPPPEGGGGEGLPGTGLPGPQPRAAGVTAHDALSLSFDAALDPALVPYAEDFLVMCDAVTADVDTVAVASTLVDLTFVDDLPEAQAMSVGYTPGSVPLQGKDGTPVTKFSNFPVSLAGGTR